MAGEKKKMVALYRYISFESFMQIILFHEDRVSRPISWQDKTEGYLYQYLENPDGRRELIDGIFYNFSHQNIEVCIDTFLKLAHAYLWCYCQCWTTQEERELMWRANSFGNHAIRIETDKETVLKILKKNFKEGDNSIYRSKIKYDLERFEPLKQIGWLTESKRASEPFMHKLKEYSYEEEYRFIVQQNSKDELTPLLKHVVFNIFHRQKEEMNEIDLYNHISQELQNAYITLSGNTHIPNSISFSIPEELLGSYIARITVHPEAPEWYVQYVERICKQYRVNFKGKSDLYEPAFSSKVNNNKFA